MLHRVMVRTFLRRRDLHATEDDQWKSQQHNVEKYLDTGAHQLSIHDANDNLEFPGDSDARIPESRERSISDQIKLWPAALISAEPTRPQVEDDGDSR